MTQRHGRDRAARGGLSLAAVLGVLVAAPLYAQTPSGDGFDSRWTPYLGCWRIAQEQAGAQTLPAVQGMMVCVSPSGPSGVTIATTVDGKNVLEQTIVADGTAQPVSQADCQGTQVSEWSRDSERLFTRVELECGGRPTRVVSGISQMAKGHWIDAQATVINRNNDVRLRRYRRTNDQPTGALASRDRSTGALSLEDVIEASGKVQSQVIEAVLVESGGRFSLDSRALKQLADAGVSPNVIDVMVAQAYPDRFRIERPSIYPPLRAGGTTWSGGGSGLSLGSAVFTYPMYDSFYSSQYYYSPFAYPYYWGSSYGPDRYGYGLGYRYGYPGTVYAPINPGARGSAVAQPGSPDSSGGDGVVVNGRGYTRVRPTSASDRGGGSVPAARTTGSGGAGVSSGASDSSSSSGSSRSSGGSESGGGYSSGGGSSSGSSGRRGGGGRTAQPR